jgi:hypothetical protein
VSELRIPKDLKDSYEHASSPNRDCFDRHHWLARKMLIERIAQAEAERDELKRIRFSEESGSTHWVGCWKDHYHCAMFRIAELEYKVESLSFQLISSVRR